MSARRRMFEENVAVPMDPDRAHRGISGSILPLNDGSLLFVHAVETNPLKCECWLEARRSRDGGRTWGEPFSPLARERNFETIAPTLLRLDNGEVLLFYNARGAQCAVPGDGATTRPLWTSMPMCGVRRTTAATWSSPVCAAHYPASCQSQADKVTRLSSGRIVIPCAGFWLTGGDHCVALCFFSDDGGYSWWPSRNFVDVGGATEEPSVVEMDGRAAVHGVSHAARVSRPFLFAGRWAHVVGAGVDPGAYRSVCRVSCDAYPGYRRPAGHLLQQPARARVLSRREAAGGSRG